MFQKSDLIEIVEKESVFVRTGKVLEVTQKPEGTLLKVEITYPRPGKKIDFRLLKDGWYVLLNNPDDGEFTMPGGPVFDIKKVG